MLNSEPTSVIGPRLNQQQISLYLEEKACLINHISTSLLPRPPLDDLFEIGAHLNKVLVGHAYSLSLSNQKILNDLILKVK